MTREIKLEDETTDRIFEPCPCGAVPEKLMLQVSEKSKLGFASGSCCDDWKIEFLRGNATDPEVILDKAQLAWDSARRK